MDITIIGIITLILSVYAFIRKEEMLLGLAMFFSVFTAAIAIGIQATTTPIWPFEIPVIFWIFKQFFNIVSGKMKYDLNSNSVNKKLLICLATFVMFMIIGEIWLYINKMNIVYEDFKFYKTMYIKFSFSNITQPVRLMLFIIFTALLIIKKISKTEIKNIIKCFEYGCMFGIIWGFVQYILNLFNIPYPVFLFNSNPYVSQGYEQQVGNLKRITSIGSEPPVFGFVLIVFIPLIVAKYKQAKLDNKNEKIKYMIWLILAIICGLLTTSSTFYLGYSVLVFVYVIYILFVKKEKFRNKLIHIAEIGFANVILMFLVFGLLTLPNYIKIKKNVEKFNKEENIFVDKQEDEKEKENEKIKTKEAVKTNATNAIETLYSLTIEKLSSGSGKIRLTQEKTGLQLFLNSPIIGLGYGSIATYTLFINVLVNFGIIGEILFITFIMICVITIIKNKEKDRLFALGILGAIFSIVIGFASSISDLTYLFFWGILILGYKYFTIEKDEKIEINSQKENLIIGIDARGLGNKKTGIATYIEQVMRQISKNKDDKTTKYILYSNREIKINIELNENIEFKIYNRPAGTLWVYYCLPKILKKDKVDIFWGTQHLLPERNNYTSSIKYVLTVHDLANHKFKHIGEWKNAIIQKVFLKRSCQVADKIMADSESTKNDIIEILDINEEKIDVVYLGTNCSREYILDTTQENDILNKFNVANRKFIFFVSTIEPRKNIVTLVKAFNQIKEDERCRDYKLILAGGLGWNYDDILNTIHNSQYKEDINLAGYISKEEKECLMHNAKCFVYPSLYEGFGLPILEAMQKGAIVVTSNISSIPEVGGNVPFYLENVYDEKELSELIKTAIFLDNEERNNIINKGYEQVSKFTWENCSEKVNDILKNG